MKRVNTCIAVVILVLLIAHLSILSASFVTSQTLTSFGTITSGGQPSGPNYVVYQSGGVNYVQDGSGSTVYSSSSVTSTFSKVFGLVASGGTITVQPGTYVATGSVQMNNCVNVHLIFVDGAVLTIGDGLNCIVLYVKYSTNCTLTNLTIDGNGKNQNSAWVTDGIMLYDCSNVLVEDSTITNCFRDGFATCDDVAGNEPNGIVNSVITHCGWNGMTLGSGGEDTFGVYAINNEVAYCSDVGITSYGLANRIIGNYIHDMNGTTNTKAHWAIGVEQNGYNLISNNTILNVNVGLSVAPDTPSGSVVAKSNLIIYNTITNCAMAGISTSGDGYDIITRNTINNWGTGYSFGIKEENGANNIITYNTLTSSSSDTTLGYPIYSSNTFNSSICYNTITTNIAAGISGIFITGGTDNTLIEGNTIQAKTGITISGSSCDNNRVYQNTLNCNTAIANTEQILLPLSQYININNQLPIIKRSYNSYRRAIC
jgi:hypothetical protein